MKDRFAFINIYTAVDDKNTQFRLIFFLLLIYLLIVYRLVTMKLKHIKPSLKFNKSIKFFSDETLA